MNERIRELVKQAIGDVDYIRDDDFTNEELSKMYIPDCFAEKFAELIVEECAEVLLKWKKEPFPFDEDLAASLIKEHFGIKK